MASRLGSLYKTMKNLKILIKHLINEYWGEPVSGSGWQQASGDSIPNKLLMRKINSDGEIEDRPSPDKMNQTTVVATDLDVDVDIDKEQTLLNIYLKKMGMEDKELPGKTYK